MSELYKIFKNSPIAVHSPEEMRALGRRIAAVLQPGQTLGLVGNLGAGKTHLTQGILEGLGASQPAVSPTFSLVHEHVDGRIPAAHFDFYRMKSPEEAISIGWDDYLDGNRILIAEWADKFDGELMPPSTDWIVIEHVGETERAISWRKA